MGPAAHATDIPLKDNGPRTGHHLGESGALDVMRITREIPTTSGDLLFMGAPARAGSTGRSLLISFTNEMIRPAPSMDAENGRIHLYYPSKDHPEVKALLNSKRNRFCYYWRSSHGRQTHAWLLSSR